MSSWFEEKLGLTQWDGHGDEEALQWAARLLLLLDRVAGTKEILVCRDCRLQQRWHMSSRLSCLGLRRLHLHAYNKVIRNGSRRGSEVETLCCKRESEREGVYEQTFGQLKCTASLITFFPGRHLWGSQK